MIIPIGLRKNIRLAIAFINFILWAMVGAVLCAMYSCARVQYVPVETIKTDSVRVVDVQRDSIYVQDSVIVREKADTIFVTRWRTEYREALRVDTVQIVRTDSVQNVVEVERELSKLQQTQMDIGRGVMWAVPILIALWLLYRKFLK